MLSPGLYEQVVSDALSGELADVPDPCKALAPVDAAEAPGVLTSYVAEVVRRGMDAVGVLDEQVKLANRIVAVVRDACGGAGTDDGGAFASPVSGCDRPEQLLALLDADDPRRAAGKTAFEAYLRPETSLARSSLFTGAVHEPQMFSELKREIASADRIDMLVSFIKWSGLRLVIDELWAFAQAGGRLRVVTTSYLGATDAKAVEALAALPGTEVKVSYDTKRTRLHAKAYVFHRATGFTTAYVGSSNLSNAAISSGLEWNVKLTRKDLPETIDKIAATFESYWSAPDFEAYGEGGRERLTAALRAERRAGEGGEPGAVYTVDVRPYPFQQEILDRLAAERSVRGCRRNLVVAATGTGKTVVAALDYRRFCREHPKGACRLLFVAHREEILRHSLATFRAVLKDANFGDLFVGGHRPDSIDHLFMSIQTFNVQGFAAKTPADYYDYIVVDEFHHAAAPAYAELLGHYDPQVLLGLTATPERMDGKSILPYFGDRIAAEIRLPEAVDRKLLCPFQYFGVTDTVDLREVRWSRGAYDRGELSRAYTVGEGAAGRADLVVRSLVRYAADMDDVRALAFCASVEHAAYMSAYFNAHGVPSLCLTGATPAAERFGAQRRLVSGELCCLCVVDIYNEGVDIPEVNTVLFLRPTESLTVFLQQLGRGLRLAPGKDCLTVLDFVGQANRRYNFEGKLASLLLKTSHDVSYEIGHGFTDLPRGCFVQLEKKAAGYILDNIRASYGSARGLVSRIAAFTEDSGLDLTLANFLGYYRLDARSLYRRATFARLCVQAGMRDPFDDELEPLMRKAFSRFAVVDSRRWIVFILDILDRLGTLDVESLSEVQLRMLQMFYVTVWDAPARDWRDGGVLGNLRALASNPAWVGELRELLRYRFERIDVVDEPVDVGFACPLDLHCTYTRDQLLVALDVADPSSVREGVRWLPDKQADVLLVTLNKSDKDYSPTTMYRDYSVSDTLFHWQSQNKTSERSVTGQRYIHHDERGSRVLLFVREFKTDAVSGTAAAYMFLGTAHYVEHEGSCPMSILWRLDRPIPAKCLCQTGKLIAG